MLEEKRERKGRTRGATRRKRGARRISVVKKNERMWLEEGLCLETVAVRRLREITVGKHSEAQRSETGSGRQPRKLRAGHPVWRTLMVR
jgi:hypothetical protein